MAIIRSLLRIINARWAVMSLGLLLTNSTAFGAWGYSWLYVSGATVDGGAISEGDYWDCYEFAGCGIAVDVDLTGPGTYLGHAASVDYWGSFAQANVFAWTSGYGWYYLNASHTRQDPDNWNWISFATTQASAYLEDPNPPLTDFQQTGTPALNDLQQSGALESWSGDIYGNSLTLNFQAGAGALGIPCLINPACAVTVTAGGAVIWVVYTYWDQIRPLLPNIHIIWSQKAPSPTGSWPGYDKDDPAGDGWSGNANDGYTRPTADGGTERIKPDGLGGQNPSSHGPHWDYTRTGPGGGGIAGTGRIYDDMNSNGGVYEPSSGPSTF